MVDFLKIIRKVSLGSDDFKEYVKLEDGTKFVLHLVNYHWGDSEHKINGKEFDGEVRHYKTFSRLKLTLFFRSNSSSPKKGPQTSLKLLQLQGLLSPSLSFWKFVCYFLEFIYIVFYKNFLDLGRFNQI